MSIKQIDVKPWSRQAEFQPSSLNEQERTVDVIFSTGAEVRRFPFFEEPFIEVLSLDSEHVDLSRLNEGAPVLNNHRREEIDDVIGVVENARTDGTTGTATIRFSNRPEVDPIFRDVKDGILRNISVGYFATKAEKSGERNGINVMTITEWQPFELSFVPVGADAGARVRAQDERKLTMDDKVVDTSTSDMPVEEEEQKEVLKQEQPAEQERSVQADTLGETMDKEKVELEARQAGAKQERERCLEIRSSVKKAGLEEALAEKLIHDGKSVDEARGVIIDSLAKEDKEVETKAVHAEVTRDANDTIFRGAQNAILHRANPAKYELDELGREYRGSSLVDMCRSMLAENGEKRAWTMTKNQVVSKVYTRNNPGNITTSFLSGLLEDSCNKVLRDAFSEMPRTFMPFTRMGTVSDFKSAKRIQLSNYPSLLEVPESMEIKAGKVLEESESISAKTYARMLHFSRESMINDDLGGLMRIVNGFGVASARLESDLVWGEVLDNPVLSNGNALYSAANGNLTTGPGTAIDAASLGVAREYFRTQRGVEDARLNLPMQWLWVPPELETVAEQNITAINPDDVTKVNPFGPTGRTPLQLIVEPRLSDAVFNASASGTAWYASSALAMVDMVELVTLEGESGPSLVQEDQFEVLGMSFRVHYDIGVRPIDYRGLYKNDGA